MTNADMDAFVAGLRAMGWREDLARAHAENVRDHIASLTAQRDELQRRIAAVRERITDPHHAARMLTRREIGCLLRGERE